VTDARPPYRAALLTSLAVMVGYVATLAPTVTFWDAGEFITAAKTLGIPHPPGAPLFVLIANVWGRLLPFGAYAWRINLLSGVCSAAAAGFWFLVAHDVIARLHHEIDDKSRAALATLGGVAAALLVSFSFSTWQSATEAEVYASAMLGIAIVAWIATRWRIRRSDAAGSRMLLLALYLGALAVGNHIMGLLVGPALVVSLVAEARRSPLHGGCEQEGEWARIWVIGAAWVLLIGVGLGNGAIALLGALLLVAAAVKARRAEQLRFALLAVVVVAVGVSTLLFLVLRARQYPWLNSGNPRGWHALLDVLRRAQYPVRTPLDDPTVMHGAENPGRTLTLLSYQIANYAQYFDWQWASGFGDLALKSYPRLLVTLVMATLGIRGAFAQRRADPASFALVATLFFMTGPALVLYLNFRPGPSIGWDRWLHLVDHEVRDRDYFFVASFVAWGIWVAIALAEIARDWIPRVRVRMRPMMSGVFAVALVPLVCNFRATTRRDTPEATLARDFAHALLGSVPPDAVLFTYGDNDTFPLWYAQQVEGFRPDVVVICLSLAQTSWYINALQGLHHVNPELIDTLRPFRAPHEATFSLDGHGVARVVQGAVVNPADVLVIGVLRTNAGRRPVAWSISAADRLFGLEPELVQQGMALVLPVAPADSPQLVGGAAAGPGGVLLDVATTRRLIDDAWRFGRLELDGSARLDANIQAVTGTIVAPITQTGIALIMRGDTAAGVAMLRRAVRLADDSLAKATLRSFAP
jgi:hypothetical protein